MLYRRKNISSANVLLGFLVKTMIIAVSTGNDYIILGQYQLTHPTTITFPKAEFNKKRIFDRIKQTQKVKFYFGDQ